MNAKFFNLAALGLVIVAAALLGFKNISRDKVRPILNVSYDPTRELYKEINAGFISKYEEETGGRIGIEQSHGGSTRQARAVARKATADRDALQNRLDKAAPLTTTEGTAPARRPNSMSDSLSPTTIADFGSNLSSAAARFSSPSAGFRQAQPASGVCGQK